MKRARELSVRVERWPIRGGFTISRGSKREAVVVVATIRDGDRHGHGECVPYARYGESVEGVVQAIEACGPAIVQGLDRAEPSGPAPGGRGSERARLRAVGPRSEEVGTECGGACRSRAAACGRDGLHHLACIA